MLFGGGHQPSWSGLVYIEPQVVPSLQATHQEGLEEARVPHLLAVG